MAKQIVYGDQARHAVLRGMGAGLYREVQSYNG